MDIREQLSITNSTENIELVANWVAHDDKKFRQLLKLFLDDEYRIVQRAAHALGKVVDINPEAIQPHIVTLVKKLSEPDVPVAIKRNIVRVLQYIDIPEEYHGALMNVCFNLLADVNEAIAVRVFSMTILDHLSKHYPEIKQELYSILEDQMELGCTAAFRSRAKKILKKK
ncbi:MAG: hypothetical protein H6551_01515 [Chitinophagales bacterium]|nr:hypothetical protein [Chitinophagales bacterium]